MINTIAEACSISHGPDGVVLYEYAVCPTSVALATLRTLQTTHAELVDARSGSGPAWPPIAEAAALLRFSKPTIWARIRSGLFSAKRLLGGQTVLVDQRNMLALLEDIPINEE